MPKKTLQQPMKSNSAILAIETSVPKASVALWVDGAIVYQKDFTSDRNHNSMIFTPLGEALAILDEVKLSCVLVGTGPGSYSGARTGIAAGQGVALTHGCSAVGIGSLAATSLARAEENSLAIGNARRGLYFISELTTSGEASESELMEADEFQTKLAGICETKETKLFTLDDPTGSWLEGLKIPAAVEKDHPHASRIIEVWLGLTEERQDELKSMPLSPSYLRPPFTSKAKSGHPLLRSPEVSGN